MIIIAHRGATETAHENTLQALRDAIQVGADMIEVDIRLTKDKIPVLSHNLHLYGTQRRELAFLRRYTLAELQKRTGASEHPITSLEMALTECQGKILLNLEVKEISAVGPTLAVIDKHLNQKADWNSLIFSSFKPLALVAIRKRVPHATLSLLHYRNPFIFIVWHRALNLSAVGFYQSNLNSFALKTAKIFGLFVYTYTVGKRKALLELNKETVIILKKLGVNGMVTDYPSRLAIVTGRKT